MSSVEPRWPPNTPERAVDAAFVAFTHRNAKLLATLVSQSSIGALPASPFASPGSQSPGSGVTRLTNDSNGLDAESALARAIAGVPEFARPLCVAWS